MKWTHASTLRVVGSIVSIVGFTMVLKGGKAVISTRTFSRDDSSQKLLWVPGLQNLGNNCFFNVVLQALASCCCFKGFLQSLIRESRIEDLDENMPLTVSLATLFEELSLVSAERVTLSPRKLMHAMSHHIPNFDLTSQQDAAEALLHLLCSLREESGGCYTPKTSSLADAFASNNRNLTSIQKDLQSEQERWRQLFLGPFDGILGSTLTCQSCLSQISINFEHFDCLPLSPMLSDSFTIRVGCTLVDCLKQFIFAEHVENYHCSHCWHNAAIKYLCMMEGDKVELEKLRRCSDQELCDCRKMYSLEKLPWSNRFSHVLKQLSIARCPRILCMQLKRAHMSGVGEPFKVQGHISFPLILDVSSFMTSGLGVKMCEVDVQNLPLNLHCNRRNSLPNHCSQHSEMSTLKFSGIYGESRDQIHADCLSDDGFVSSTNRQELVNDNVIPCSGSIESIHSDTQMPSVDEMDVSRNLVSQQTSLYQLVSVVEHFGRAGTGHYTVYRCAGVESPDVSGDYLNQQSVCWFCVSDSQVHAVSVEDVLSAEASLLFYERIPN